MTPERWRQIEELYNLACERGDGVLADADPELRREVLEMLAQKSGGKILDQAAFDLMTDSSQTQMTAGSRLGPYMIEALLGTGGMGEVFRATDTRLGREVAVKVSRETFNDRFEREARAIAALNHPNICTVHDVGPNYLVMELLEGETLAARLKRGRLPMEQTIQYGEQIASALSAAHAKGIIHRDLKPGNVMITKTGAKVLDFGLAKSAQDQTFTLANAIMGTPAYMAPEQREGKVCDARTDIYALGLVLSEMATGNRPQPGERPQLDSLPEKLAHTVERCLSQDPEDRWQSARDVKSELEWVAIAPPSAEMSKRLMRLWPTIAACAVLGLAALAFVHFREAGTEMSVRYATILPPEKTSFDFANNHGPVALSPDGKRMVFAATGEDGKSQLWLRALDTADAQPLPGTEGGAWPFWSPDSLWIAFFADGAIKKLDTRGGPPIMVAESIGGAGGSWSPNGTIVFSPNIMTPLLKIPSDGGDTSVAVAMDTVGSGRGFPCFLPDGEHFLFAAWGAAGRMQLRVGSLSSTASSAIGEADSNGIYSQGHLLYLRENSLMAQPFDLKSLRTTGGAVPVAEHVGRFLNLVEVGAFSASATGLLAYQTGAVTALRQLTWFDRQGKSTGTVGEARSFFGIQFSPDRKTLAVTAPDAGGNYDLWMYDVARGVSTRFTVDPAKEFWPVFSPDGRSVIFESNRKGPGDLYRKPANGAGAEELLYADDMGKVPTSWSHDGKFLLYFTPVGPRYEMWVLPLTQERPGAPLKPLPFHQTGFNEADPQFSPDGKWVAYNSNESGRVEIYVSPFSRQTEKHQISRDGGVWSRWSEDGKKIYYQGPGGQLMEAEIRISEETVQVGTVRPMFTRVPPTGGYVYEVSADGQRLLAAVPVAKAAQPITLVENWSARLKK